MSLQPGATVERYVVEELLGEGGMARVYRVRHADLGTRHALKVLTVRSADLDERFLQEGRLQATLRHPNIVAVTDVLQLPQGPALIMDWIPGPSLHAARLLNLAIDDALGIFRALLHGIGFAHSQGIIHRDIKPDNILLELSEDGIHPRIVDFGLARVIQESPATPRRTRTGITMGTPTYMAPEQMTDASRCDERSDLYAMGAILYEMLSGRVPYAGADMVSVALAQREERHPPLYLLRPSIPQRISDLVDGLLARQPKDRPASCLEVLALLDRRPYEPSALRRGAPPLTGALLDTLRTPEPAARPAPAPTPVPGAPRRTLAPDSAAPESPAPDPSVLPALKATPRAIPRRPRPAAEVKPAAAPAPSEPKDRLSLDDPPAAPPAPAPSEPEDRLRIGDPPAAPPAARLARRAAPLLLVLLVLLLLPAIYLLLPTPSAPPDAPPPAALQLPIPTEPPPAPAPLPAAPPPEPVALPEPETPPAAPPSAPPAAAAPASVTSRAIASPPPDPEPEIAAAPEPLIGPGHFQVLGDAQEVALRREGQRFGPSDPLEPGTYEILARFDGGELQVAGQLSVVAADRPVIRCASALQLCTRLP